MANKPTKKALLLSALSMILCLAMLVGTTFAWFTDSVASGKNTIKAGNLDVELKYLKNGAWTDVQGATDLFDPNALWEPGHAEVVYLQIKNAGTLDLKYQFSMNIISETVATNVLGGNFTLSQYLMYGVTDYTAAYATREEAIAAVKANESKFADYSMVGQLLDGEAKEIALVVYMPTTVGNEANYRGDVVPSIDFGLNLVATQLVSEEDFFDNTYDEDASLLPTWDGTATAADELTKDANGVYQIGSAEDLAGFAALVNGGTANVSAVLTADIDLGNKPWTPIGVSGAPFNGTFDGNGYTIYNLNVSGTTSVGFIGNAGNSASIYNVKIDGATVSGNHYVGTVLGYGYLSANSLAGCTVQNATVVCTPDANNDNGDKAGVIAGMAINGNIYNNKAINSTVYAYRDFGGIVGCAQSENRNISVYGNSVENVELFYVECDNYADGKANQNMKEVVGRVSEHASFKVTIGDNSAKDVVLNNNEDDTITVATPDNTVASVGKNETVYFAPGEYTDIPALNEGSTIIGTDGVVFKDTLSGTMNNTTIKNVEFKSGNAQRWAYAHGTLVFEDCTFDATSVYAIHYDGLNGANITYKNCKIVGWVAIGGGAEHITFDNCEIYGNGRYGLIRLYSEGTIKNCTFDVSAVNTTDVYQDGIHAVDCTVTVENTTNVNGDVKDLFNVSGTGVIKFEDGVVVRAPETMKTAIANGETTLYLADGEYDLNGNQKDGLTFIGLGDNAKVANTTKYASGKSAGAIWKAINLENVTLTNTVYTMADGGNATFKDVNFAAGVRQAYGKNVKFDGCTFGSNTEGYALHFQTDSASEGGEIKLDACEFLGGKVHLGGKRAYTFTGCDFKAGTDFQVWSNITLDGCTVDGAAVTAENIAALFPNLNLAKVTVK